ncbi:MAG: DNA primase, partial [Polymorphobacter sp.]
MTIPPAFLDEIRSRVALAAVVGRRVKLTRAGHEWKGCCPFHNEKTPSFYVNEDKGFYHCFGCGVHGDVIRFVTEQEGLSFPDAVRQLADEAGLEMPVESPEARARAAAQVGLHDVTAAASAWFTEQLGSVEGAEARAYLTKRGIDGATARAFGLGLAPDSKAKLKTALAGLGMQKLIDTGLLIAPDEPGRDPYDRFRGRLMFPIRDPRGRIIGFGGRIMGDGQPKYLNSPDTVLFDKGRTLYNFERAGPVARKSTRLLVVEGYMDVIALAQAGIAEAVAPLGTALTETQLALLWRVVPEPILCF